MRMDRNLDVYYQQEELGHVESPTIVTDVHGKILLWYLPNILGADIKVS
jgi:hypothetical protein